METFFQHVLLTVIAITAASTAFHVIKALFRSYRCKRRYRTRNARPKYSNSYLAFMNSQAWWNQKRRVRGHNLIKYNNLNTAQLTCEHCHATTDTPSHFHVHHTYYVKPLHKTPDDALIILCPRCHKKVHNSPGAPSFKYNRKVFKHTDVLWA